MGPASARAFEYALTRELARVGGAASRPRPRIAPIVGNAPLELASGHSFATDLVEIAGGSSVTHELPETDAPRLALPLDDVLALAPDLLLVMSPHELAASERRAVRHALPSEYPVEFFVFDTDLLWSRDSGDAARRLQALIRRFSQELRERGRGRNTRRPG